jgi:hypothetical protein
MAQSDFAEYLSAPLDFGVLGVLKVAPRHLPVWLLISARQMPVAATLGSSMVRPSREGHGRPGFGGVISP